MTDNICKICNSIFKYNEKKSSHINGTCSYTCLRKTNIVRIKFLKTFLKVRNIEFSDNDSAESLEIKYSKVMSDITKISTIKKHETIRKQKR